MGIHPTRDDLESIGFFVCVADLEDELVAAQGRKPSSRSSTPRASSGPSAVLQRQPFHRDRTIEQLTC